MGNRVSGKTLITNQFENIPAVILAGGRPILYESAPSGRINKALISINGRPLLWWNLVHYAKHGVREFLIAAGAQADAFHDILAKTTEADIFDATNNIYNIRLHRAACRLRLIKTDPDANTAERLIACEPYLKNKATFCVTYSDTLSDVNLTEELMFHRESGLVATVVAAKMPVRFRVLGIRHSEYLVRAFASKPVIQSVPVNGGYYFFQREFISDDYLGKGESPLEEKPLERLVGKLQLAAYEHQGAWQHLDGERDLPKVAEIASLIENFSSR